jgi:hypothetical protein
VVIHPVTTPAQSDAESLLIAGVSARKLLGRRLSGISRTGSQTDRTAVAAARAYEEEKRRSEALAELERIVQRYSGKIWLESQSGEGATFRFTVPAVTGVVS